MKQERPEEAVYSVVWYNVDFVYQVYCIDVVLHLICQQKELIS